MSLIDRCQHFRKEFPTAKINPTLLRKVYRLNHIKKKKVVEEIVTSLRIADSGVLTWNGHIVQTGKGTAKTLELVDAPVS